MNKTTRIVMILASFMFTAAGIVVAASLSGLYVFCFLPLMGASWLLANKVVKDRDEQRNNDRESIKILNTFNELYKFMDYQLIEYATKTTSVKSLTEMLEDWDDINELDPLEEEHNSNVLHMTLEDYRNKRLWYDVTFKEFIQKRITQLK